MIVTVGRIGRAHGIRGEVAVEVRTDSPEERFVEGTSMATEPAAVGPLKILRARWHSGRMLVQFDAVADRTAAEALRGTLLLAEIGDDERPDDPDEYFDHQLIGLSVATVSGADLGVVRDVVHAPGQDLLAVDLATGGEALVPFVAEIVPEVDVAASRLVVDPPPGLLDLGEVGGEAE